MLERIGRFLGLGGSSTLRDGAGLAGSLPPGADFVVKDLPGPGIRLRVLQDADEVIRRSREDQPSERIQLFQLGRADETASALGIRLYGGSGALRELIRSQLSSIVEEFGAERRDALELSEALDVLPLAQREKTSPAEGRPAFPYKMERIGEMHILSDLGDVEGEPMTISSTMHFPDGASRPGAILITPEGVQKGALRDFFAKTPPPLPLREVASGDSSVVQAQPNLAELEARVRERTGAKELWGLQSGDRKPDETQSIARVLVFGVDAGDASAVVKALSRTLTHADIEALSAAPATYAVEIFIVRGGELGERRYADGRREPVPFRREPQPNGTLKVFIGPEGIRNLDKVARECLRHRE